MKIKTDLAISFTLILHISLNSISFTFAILPTKKISCTNCST